jgi:hypothetical protein
MERRSFLSHLCVVQIIKVKPYDLHSAAILTSLDAFSGMKQLYVEMLHGRVVLEMPGITIIEMANHFIVELYTEIAEIPEYLFKDQRTVLGYHTENIQAAYDSLVQGNYPLLCPVQQAGDCYSYFHFRAADGQIYKISQLNKNKHS